jgi:hypothetical protein
MLHPISLCSFSNQRGITTSTLSLCHPHHTAWSRCATQLIAWSRSNTSWMPRSCSSSLLKLCRAHRLFFSPVRQHCRCGAHDHRSKIHRNYLTCTKFVVTEPTNYTKLSKKIIHQADDLANLSPYNPIVHEIMTDFKPTYIPAKIVISLAVTITNYIKVHVANTSEFKHSYYKPSSNKSSRSI